RHVRRERFILGEKKIQRLAVKLARLGIRTEVWDVVTAFLEILITRRAFLTIPALLVRQFNRCQDRKPFNRQRDMCKVSNRAMAVLKIKCIEKLLRLLRAD